MLLRRRYAILVAVLLCSAALAAQTTIHVVRHAEKDRSNPSDRDPSLTKAGVARAKALANVLRSVKLTAIYATDYKRTRETAAPVAKQAGLEPRVPEPDTTTRLLQHLVEDHKDGQVLVVAHSNTMPAILRGLGIKKKLGLLIEGYDNHFTVLVAKDGKTTMLHLHYGKRSDK